MRKYAWFAFGLAIALSSCAVGPKYRPQTPEQLNVPAAWTAALPENAKSGIFRPGGSSSATRSSRNS